MFYQVPGNTQKKSARAIPTATDPHCVSAIGSDECDDIEILAILESKDPKEREGDSVTAKKEQEIKVRTLGGMRLRYRYIPPSLPGLKMTKVTWKINHLGRYCKKYGVEDAGDCEEREANVEFEQKQPNAIAENIDEVGDWSIYWEPLTKVTRNNAEVKEADWSNWAGTNTDDAGVTANLNAEYTVPVTTVDSYGNSTSNPDGVTRYYKSDFTLHTRELKPAKNGSEPMAGSDVAMLEAMLWEFGISPQKGSDHKEHSNAGKAGARINSDRGHNLGWTQTCDGAAATSTSRSTFTSGWESCESGRVALEGMVKRFNSRSFETSANTIKEAGASKGGALDQEGVNQLGVLWADYIRAVNLSKDPLFDRTKLIDADWQAFTNAMAGTINFVSPAKTDTIDLQYDDELHQSAMSAQEGSATRIEFVKAWAAKENDRQWGANNTAYRISEGGADEVGSIGFSQLWFSYIYGKLNTCSKISGINMYNPHNNLLGFAIWAGTRGCGASMYKAFNTSTYDITVATTTVNTLRGYMCTNAAGNAAVCNYQPENYERLVKGLVGYNRGTDWRNIKRCSLAEILAGITRNGFNCGVDRTRGENVDYGLTILHGSLPTDPGGINPHFLSLPDREFVWVGERYAADLKLEDGITPDPRAGTPKWCFKYGETEWRASSVYGDIKQNAEDYQAGMPTPGAVDSRTSCQ